MRAAAHTRSAAQRPLPLPLLARAGLERSGKNPVGAAAPAPADRPTAPRRAIRPRTGAGASPIWLCRLGDWRSGGSCAAAWSAPTLTRAPLQMRNRTRPFFQPCVWADQPSCWSEKEPSQPPDLHDSAAEPLDGCCYLSSDSGVPLSAVQGPRSRCRGAATGRRSPPPAGAGAWRLSAAGQSSEVRCRRSLPVGRGLVFPD